ncbi:hypothetical protein P3X46_030587 [Hevea brasiliensis]|uniref:Uncharacterized protein n=1 Tax=Hevea brasiliensis TaxID=3981 RepID=A0ABQ9KJ95_HEVBR|nr:hypothetical protein P3X46_030587 [Hevea brasiliensis]
MVLDTRPGPIGDRIGRIWPRKLKRRGARRGRIARVFRPFWAAAGWLGRLGGGAGEGRTQGRQLAGGRGGEEREKRERRGGRRAREEEEEKEKRPVRFDRSDPVRFDSAGSIRNTKF